MGLSRGHLPHNELILWDFVLKNFLRYLAPRVNWWEDIGKTTHRRGATGSIWTFGKYSVEWLSFLFFSPHNVPFHPVKSVELKALIQVCSETCILIYLQQSSHGKHSDTLDLGIWLRKTQNLKKLHLKVFLYNPGNLESCLFDNGGIGQGDVVRSLSRIS